MDNKRTAYFNRFSIDMTLEQAKSVSHSGDCEPDVLELMKDPEIQAQLEAISPEVLSEELRGYGAWEEKDRLDLQTNRERILWLAGGNIIDEEKDDGQN